MLWWSFVGLFALANGIGEELIEPDELILTNSITWLEVHACNWTIGDIVTLQTRCYCYQYEGVEKCSIPGPTLVFTNGTDGFVRLANHLQGVGHLDVGNVFAAEDLTTHDPDVINLHVHGLHVDPLIDDVVDRLVPPNNGTYIDYNFTILPDHYPGLHWYHDHWHGTVAFHVHTGLFGAIKMNRENDLGIDPNLAAMKSRVVILHGLSLNNASLNENGECDCDGYVDWFDGGGKNIGNNPLNLHGFHLTTICDQWCDLYCFQRLASATPPIQRFHHEDWENHLPSGSVTNWDGGNTLFLTNGQIQPKITIATNEWLRLRLLNSDAQGSFFLQFDNTSCQHYFIAADGIFFDKARDLNEYPYNNIIYMSMAGRAEVILKCSETGDFNVMQIPDNPNSIIHNTTKCNPAYNALIKMFTISVTTTNPTNDYNASSMTFPPKTGYIATTIDAGETTIKPQCVHYNASGVDYIHWEMDPDPRKLVNCSSVTVNLPYFGPQTITGKLFGINGQYFRHDAPLAVLLPNSLYQMNITFFSHPFHHHINPFQLLEDVADGFLGKKGEWRDVLSPGCGSNHGAFSARTRTLDYVGKVVMHCHFLPHEDRGLMGYYIINDTNCSNTDPYPVPRKDHVACNQTSSDAFCFVQPIAGASNLIRPIFPLSLVLVLVLAIHFL